MAFGTAGREAAKRRNLQSDPANRRVVRRFERSCHSRPSATFATREKGDPGGMMRATDSKLIALLRANAREPTASLATQAESRTLHRAGTHRAAGTRRHHQGLYGEAFRRGRSGKAAAVVMISTDPKQRRPRRHRTEENDGGSLALGGCGSLRPDRNGGSRNAGAASTPCSTASDARSGVARTVSSIILSEKFAR